ncbi:peptide-methionine (S)-S-oxide reductase MsrA [bacterium]|nr:peptide-methionine (S)-S-oxide reductase MsrA [bacterium]
MSDNYETAVFGGGCFWCLEAVFSQIKGVISVESGYAGGFKENPTYEEVCSGTTGHAEVIKIEYDPDIISYEKLLEIFFYIHNPTTLNRQGNDIGEQYRSIILYNSRQQKATAEKFIRNLSNSKNNLKAIVTEIKQLDNFNKAENYHQNYFTFNSSNPYCQIIISPKIKSFKEKFGNLLK